MRTVSVMLDPLNSSGKFACTAAIAWSRDVWGAAAVARIASAPMGDCTRAAGDGDGAGGDAAGGDAAGGATSPGAAAASIGAVMASRGWLPVALLKLRLN